MLTGCARDAASAPYATILSTNIDSNTGVVNSITIHEVNPTREELEGDFLLLDDSLALSNWDPKRTFAVLRANGSQDFTLTPNSLRPSAFANDSIVIYFQERATGKQTRLLSATLTHAGR